MKFKVAKVREYTKTSDLNGMWGVYGLCDCKCKKCRKNKDVKTYSYSFTKSDALAVARALEYVNSKEME